MSTLNKNECLDDELQTASPAMCSTSQNTMQAKEAKELNPFYIPTLPVEKDEAKLDLLSDKPPDRVLGNSKIVSSPNIALICRTKQKSKTGNPLLQKLSGMEPSTIDTHSENVKKSTSSRRVSINSSPAGTPKSSIQNNSFNVSDPRIDKTCSINSKQSQEVKKTEESKSQSKRSDAMGPSVPDAIVPLISEKKILNGNEVHNHISAETKDIKENHCCRLL